VLLGVYLLFHLASELVNHISTTWMMEKWEAYILCSIVVDLKINEVVDQPNWVVGVYLPITIFEAG
jgi:acetamidase/formamidase